MPRTPTSPAQHLAASLIVALCGCDGGLPTGEPSADAGSGLRTRSDAGARPDAHFGIALLYRQDTRDPGVTVGEDAPVAAPADAMAHDLAIWSFTTAGGQLADIVPVEALALIAVAAPPPEAGLGGVGPDGVAPAPPPEASGLSREAWRLELWRPPLGPEPAALLGVLLERSLTARRPVLAAGLRSDRDGPDGGVVLWNDDGTLTARALSLHPEAAGDASRSVIASHPDRLIYMATDTHQVLGEPVVTLASRDPARRYLVCARENASGVICAFMSQEGEVASWEPIPGLEGHTPRALTRVADGFVGLALGCKGEGTVTGNLQQSPECSSGPAASFHLDADGQPRGKRGVMALGPIAQQRPMVVVETGDGLLVWARKARPDALAVWHLTADGARTRDDALGRLLGGVRLTPGARGEDALAGRDAPSEVWLLDASPLVMRDGFPVALPRPARWSAQLGRERHVAWPARIGEAIPGHRGAPVLARERFLAFSHAPRADALAVTCLHFEPNGAATSPPEPPARAVAKRKARKKAR